MIQGKQYQLSSPVGVATLRKRGQLDALSCYSSTDGNLQNPLQVQQTSSDDRDLHTFATVIAPSSGRLQIGCNGIAEVFVDDAESSGRDVSAAVVLLSVLVGTAGVPLAVSGWYRLPPLTHHDGRSDDDGTIRTTPTCSRISRSDQGISIVSARSSSASASVQQPLGPSQRIGLGSGAGEQIDQQHRRVLGHDGRCRGGLLVRIMRAERAEQHHHQQLRVEFGVPAGLFDAVFDQVLGVSAGQPVRMQFLQRGPEHLAEHDPQPGLVQPGQRRSAVCQRRPVGGPGGAYGVQHCFA